MKFICVKFANFLAIFEPGMPKTTANMSDSEDSDDLPDLVDCTDDEVTVLIFITNFCLVIPLIVCW